MTSCKRGYLFAKNPLKIIAPIFLITPNHNNNPFIRLDKRYVITYDNNKENSAMKTISASIARANLYKLIDEAAVSAEPIQIAGKRKSVVLLSADDWAAVQETLYLLSIPGMRESIRKGLKTPLAKCSKMLKW